jgi:hypothetical protein
MRIGISMSASFLPLEHRRAMLAIAGALSYARQDRCRMCIRSHPLKAAHHAYYS